jgi:uncharacterized membrane protein
MNILAKILFREFLKDVATSIVFAAVTEGIGELTKNFVKRHYPEKKPRKRKTKT